MIETSTEFELIFSLGLGLMLGVFSFGLSFTIFLILFFEFICCSTSSKLNEKDLILIRVLIQLTFIFGWVISHFLLTRNTGFETFINECYQFYETFPN